MPTFYCSCGKAIQFKVIKPSNCPSCGKGIKSTVLASAPASAVVISINPSPTPLLPSITSEEALAVHIQKMVDEAIKGQVIRQTGAFNTPRKSSLSRTRIMERNVASVAGFKAENQGVEEVVDEEDNSSDLNDDAYDEVEAQQMARELESVVKAGFRIDGDDGDDAPIRFGDLVRQRAAQEK